MNLRAPSPASTTCSRGAFALLVTVLLGGCAMLPGAGRPAAPAQVEQIVTEDDHVRIEELRVRGVTQRVDVRNKDSVAPGYAIVPPAAGQDASQPRGNAGQRVWPLLTF